MDIYLVRHGFTEWNNENRFQGCRADVELNETGLSQAAAVAERFKNFPLNAIYSSPLKRAKKTAEEINKYHNLNIQYFEEFVECDVGLWTGMKVDEVKTHYETEYLNWMRNADMPAVEGESFNDLKERAVERFYNITETHKNEDRILIVSHGLTIRAIIGKLLNIYPEDVQTYGSFRIDNTSVTHIIYNNSKYVIASLNETWHTKVEKSNHDTKNNSLGAGGVL